MKVRVDVGEGGVKFAKGEMKLGRRGGEVGLG